MIRLLASAVLLASPVLAQGTAQPTTPVEKKICKREAIPGSQYGSRRVCRTVKESRKQAQADADSADQLGVISRNANESFRGAGKGGPQ